jgi:hypothetical protein
MREEDHKTRLRGTWPLALTANSTGSLPRWTPPVWQAASLLCLVVVFVVFVRIRLLNFPLERDEGEFAYVAQLALDGVGPYQLAYVVKLPGTYLAYTVIMGLFGQTTAAIHLGFLLVNLANLAVFYRVARRFLEIPNAMIGCACFALLSLSPGVLGLQGHATNLVVLAALGGMDCLLRARESGRGSLFWWSGLCFGLAFLFKQPGLFFGVLAVAVLFRDAAQERPARWRRCLGRVGLLAAGIAAPLALVCVAMLAAGVFDRFGFGHSAMPRFEPRCPPRRSRRSICNFFPGRWGLTSGFGRFPPSGSSVCGAVMRAATPSSLSPRCCSFPGWLSLPA